MVSKCANPNCAASFRYFHVGKLFRMETSSGLERRRSMGQDEVSKMTLICDEHMQVSVRANSRAISAAA